jgi:hypothetical protein
MRRWPQGGTSHLIFQYCGVSLALAGVLTTYKVAPRPA